MTSVLSTNVTMRVDAENFAYVNKVLVIIGIIVLFIIASLELASLVEYLWNFRKTRAASLSQFKDLLALRVYLFLQLLTSLGVTALMALPILQIPFPSYLDCNITVKFVCLLYCITTQMIYLFSIKKSSLVKGFQQGFWFKWISTAAWYGLIIFIPCFVIPVAAVITVGQITREGQCVLFLTQLWFPLIFIFGNVGLNAVLIFLFYYPLDQHAKAAAGVNEETSHMMKRVANKNLRLAYVIVLVSTLSVVGTSVVTVLAQRDMYNYDFLLQYSYSSTIIDGLVCSVCTRMMTNVWIPTCIKRLSFFSSERESSDSSNIGHGVTPVDGHFSHRMVNRPINEPRNVKENQVLRECIPQNNQTHTPASDLLA